MTRNKRVLIVLPAYNAAKTIAITYKEIPMDYVDEVLLVDDKSSDDTLRIQHSLKNGTGGASVVKGVLYQNKLQKKDG
jgi:glycosyltransferase involved in cell wall biosynthesis